MQRLARIVALAGFIPATAYAVSNTAAFDMMSAAPDGKSAKIGTVTATDTPSGLEFRLELTGLPAGEHAIHVHEKGSCAPADKNGKPSAAEAAGPHYDPAHTATHKGPYGDGHMGDLPKFVVADGVDTAVALVAPRLKLADVAGRALIIHEGGDTYADQPELGGGKSRIACAVIPKG